MPRLFGGRGICISHEICVGEVASHRAVTRFGIVPVRGTILSRSFCSEKRAVDQFHFNSLRWIFSMKPTFSLKMPSRLRTPTGVSQAARTTLTRFLRPLWIQIVQSFLTILLFSAGNEGPQNGSANLYYLVDDADVLAPHELPADWGWLKPNGDSLELATKPIWHDVDEDQRLELLHRIASVRMMATLST